MAERVDDLVNASQISTGKILITGGAGYLATNLIAQLLDNNCKITRLDRPGTIFTPVIGKAQVRDLVGDIRDRATWEVALTDVDMVFHLAAQTSVYVAEQNPLNDFEVNVMPMLHLLETCREKGTCPTVLFSGTATEFGLSERIPVDETHPDRPITIYDIHKWMSENYLLHYSRRGLVRGGVLRLANVYGPGPRSSSADRGVLNTMIRKALNGEKLTIYGQGNYVRDYVYVDDVVSAFLKAAAGIERVKGHFFIIGSEQGYTLSEAINLVAARVERKTGQRASVIHIPSPESMMKIEERNFVANTARFTQTTGWRSTVPLVEGIDRTIDYLLSKDGSL